MKNLLLAILSAIYFSLPCIAQIDTNVVVYSWKLDESLANRLRVDVDTLLNNSQVYNPVFKNYTAVQTLGNYGQPAQSAVFTERDLDQEFVIINAFMPFMKSYLHTTYYNTRQPFTRIAYRKGGSNPTKEEMFDAFHSQNITKNLNFGLHYTTFGALGHYQLQRVKNNSFNFFSSLSGKYYNYHVSVNFNKIIADENGGILGDTLVTDTTFAFTKDIPTLFKGTENSLSHHPNVYDEIKNLNILAVQELSFRSKPATIDSASTRKVRIFYPKLVYIFTLNRTSRLFTDKDPVVGLENGLYQNIFVNDSITSDSLVNWKVGNTIRLQFQGRKNNHYFIDYSYELMKYSMGVKSDPNYTDTSIIFISQPYNLSGLNYTSNQYNSSVSSGFSKIFAGRIDMNFYGRFYLTGYQARDFFISGDMKLIFGKIENPVTFYAKGSSQVKTPDFLYTRYASNYFIWTRNFNRTTSQHLSTNLAISSKKFAIQGDYYLLSNLIYMDENAQPAQYHNALSVFALSASKQFEFWKVTSINKVIYQKSENENVLDLPEIAFYSSTYLTHLFNFKATGGKLLTMLGFDLHYNTRYYADAYMPSLNSFHRQHEKLVGNYPYLDVFLNVQLKRFKFFVKADHVNEGWFDNWFNRNYFTTPLYPRNGRDLKFGLSWTFYD
jgi:hypothetical protein